MQRRTGGSRIGRRSRRAAVVLVVVAAAAAGAGCGDDDDGAAAITPAPATSGGEAAPATTGAGTAAGSGTSDTSGSATSVASGEFDQAAFCDAVMDINVAAASGGDPEEDPVAFAGVIVEPVEKAAALAPPELADTLSGIVQTLHQAVDSNDGSAMQALDPSAVDGWASDNCGWNKVPFEAAEYHFTGIPDTLPAGDYEFEMTNTGQELHVLVIVRRKPGVTESFDELLADPDGESKVDTVLGVGAAPGESASGAAPLEAGEYLLLCPIPQGSVGETPGSGPPHFTNGMHQTLTVT